VRGAAAGTITFTDARNVSWEVDFPSAIDLQFTAHAPAAGNRNTVGTLLDKTVRMDRAPLTIHFIQLTEAGDETTVSSGMRLLFETQVKNMTKDPWAGYRLQLIDGSFPAPFNQNEQDRDHPVEAHFHVLGGATYAPFNNFDPRTSAGPNSGCPDPVSPDVSCNLLVQDGVNKVDINGTLQIQNLLLHEREFSPTQMDGLSDPGRRFFDLVLTPIPEPGTGILVTSGLLAWGGLALTRAVGRGRNARRVFRMRFRPPRA
jgi:hypothetical protein